VKQLIFFFDLGNLKDSKKIICKEISIQTLLDDRLAQWFESPTAQVVAGSIPVQ
jgi:hypothetical protein